MLFQTLATLYLGRHVLMGVTQATLEDVISYSDFSQEVPLQEIMVQDLIENRPDDSLLEDILSGETAINETAVHIVSTGNFILAYLS